MNEILLGTTEKLYLKIYVGGILTDSDTIPTVTVYQDGEVLHVTTNATHDGLGEYSVSSQLADSNEEKTVEYRWAFSVSGTATTKTDIVKFVTPYMELQDVKDITTGLTYEQVIAAEKFARYMINQYIGYSFGKRVATLEVKGTGKPVLQLPERLLSVTNIKEDGVEIYDYLDADPVYGFDISDTKYALELEYDSSGSIITTDTVFGRRFKHNSVYEVTGEWGWEQVPSEVSMAARMLAEDFLCRKDLAWQAKWVTDVSGIDWKYSFNDRQFSGTGNSLADRILNPFVSQRTWGVLV